MAKLEWPKAIFGPNGEEIVVEDARQERQQRAEWAVPSVSVAPNATEAEEPLEALRRGPGRPRKVA